MRDLAGGVNASAARIAGIYLVLAVGWIVLTDLGALGMVLDPLALTGVQTAKGLFFVAGSAGLLYVLIAREQRRLSAANRELELTLRHASVLHRLLRHNLRNSCDVILNNVALLRRRRGNPTAAYDRIQRQADALVDIAEKSRHLRDLVLEDDQRMETVDLATVGRERAADVRRDFPKATVVDDLPAEATARAHPRVGIAVDELLRNAIVHAERADVRVEITGAVEGDVVTLTVADDGPGLPEMELSALEGLFEEPMEHSRGIGLWLVQFLVAKSEGDLETTVREDGGTVIQLRFQRVR